MPWQKVLAALDECLTAAGVRGPLILGFSGGLDSTVLLHAAAERCGSQQIIALHVDHGLQPDARAWASHARQITAELGCRFESVVLTPDESQRTSGVENWARRARRQAFAAAAAQHAGAAVMLAHHADDQLETLLMNWGRGAGPAGMCGMAVVSRLGAIPLLRPLLSVSRAELQACAESRQLRWVQDSSNADTRFRRNRLRHEVLPLLAEVFPGFRENVLRGASLQTALVRQAGIRHQQALSRAGGLQSFDRRELQAQNDDELDAFIHAWLRRLGKGAATRARIRHIRDQIFRSGSTYAEIAHDAGWIRRYRDTVTFADQAAASPPAQALVWSDEAELTLPGFVGTLRFPAAAEGEAGLPGALLRGPGLTVSGLAMNAKIVLHQGGPGRPLRKLCQEKGIPHWSRASLPMIARDGQILFAAGIGMHANLCRLDGPDRVALAFEPAAPIITG